VAGLGAAVVKLAVHADLRLLGTPLWPFPVDADGHLPHRPDAMVFAGGKVGIFEVAGSTSANYNRVVDARLDRIMRFVGHGDIFPRKVSLKELRSPVPQFVTELLAANPKFRQSDLQRGNS